MNKKNDEKEREVTFFDESGFKTRTERYELNLKNLNGIADLYNYLNNGKITHDRVNEIFAGKFDAIEMDALKSAQLELPGKGPSIISDAIKDLVSLRLVTYKEQTIKLVQAFERAQRIGERILPTALEDFNINSTGKFEIPETVWQRLKDEYSVIINTPEERELYDALQEVAAAYTRFLAGWGQRTREHLSPYTPLDTFISIENGIVTPKPELDYNQLAH